MNLGVFQYYCSPCDTACALQCCHPACSPGWMAADCQLALATDAIEVCSSHEADCLRTVILSVSSSRVSLNVPDTPTEATQHTQHAGNVYPLHRPELQAQDSTADHTKNRNISVQHMLSMNNPSSLYCSLRCIWACQAYRSQIVRQFLGVVHHTFAG